MDSSYSIVQTLPMPTRRDRARHVRMRPIRDHVTNFVENHILHASPQKLVGTVAALAGVATISLLTPYLPSDVKEKGGQIVSTLFCDDVCLPETPSHSSATPPAQNIYAPR